MVLERSIKENVTSISFKPEATITVNGAEISRLLQNELSNNTLLASAKGKVKITKDFQ